MKHVKILTSKASFKTVSFIACVAHIPFSMDFSMLWWFKLLMMKYLVWWILSCFGASPTLPVRMWCLPSSPESACRRWLFLPKNELPASIELRQFPSLIYTPKPCAQSVIQDREDIRFYSSCFGKKLLKHWRLHGNVLLHNTKSLATQTKFTSRNVITYKLGYTYCNLIVFTKWPQFWGLSVNRKPDKGKRVCQ